ncbi:hypothetical protein B0H16DRAFT_845138 [Mycena metata]|uniref:DUF6534 domain-containing protein n=1 Tax=Mycena metata TaxID=1033252 RepID=A0AAD7IXR7_9AGAR|nr:hypothetical protein B0H16DRAFT_845138 [Mycena metata]
MSSPADGPAFGTIIDVHFLFGPLLIGLCFNMVLFGLLISQMMTYFQTPHQDPIWMRLLIFYVLFVETANTALDLACMYQPLISEYGSIPGKLPTLLLTQPLFIILVSFPVELFFIWRLRSLTENNIIPGILLVFATLATGGGIWTTVSIAGAGTWGNVPVTFHAVTLWISASMCTDLCIAGCLAWVLRKKKTGFEGSDTVVNRIVRMTVQTGLVTALVNVLDLLSFLFIKNTTFNFMWSNPLSKLYSNCMMSTLNARSTLAQSIPDRKLSSSGVGTGIFAASPRFPVHTKEMSNDLANAEYGIRMNKVVETF